MPPSTVDRGETPSGKHAPVSESSFIEFDFAVMLQSPGLAAKLSIPSRPKKVQQTSIRTRLIRRTKLSQATWPSQIKNHAGASTAYRLSASFLMVPTLLSDRVSRPSRFLTVPGGSPRSFSRLPTVLSLLTFLGVTCVRTSSQRMLKPAKPTT
jgi:hypothetical protein